MLAAMIGSFVRLSPPGYAARVASPLVAVLLILAGVSAFATWQAHTGSSQASPDTAARAMARSAGSGLPSVTSMPATPVDPESDIHPLSNDGDSQEGGTGDALEVLAIVGFSVLLSRVGGLLLALCNGTAKLSSVCCSASERPG